MTTKQFKMWLPEELIEQLTKASKNHSRRSPQQVAAEILDTYLDFWIQLEEMKERKIADQRSRMFGESGGKGRLAR